MSSHIWQTSVSSHSLPIIDSTYWCGLQFALTRFEGETNPGFPRWAVTPLIPHPPFCLPSQLPAFWRQAHEIHQSTQCMSVHVCMCFFSEGVRGGLMILRRCNGNPVSMGNRLVRSKNRSAGRHTKGLWWTGRQLGFSKQEFFTRLISMIRQPKEIF